MRYMPFEMIPYTTQDPRPFAFSVEFGVMLAFKDVLGFNKGCTHIEAFYKGRPVILGKPKRYKHQRN
ncbi:hypothetical protein [Nibribacter koreensis]|uniref:Uncharacterized protein n=1 Tax=Nibribacter koreensis TaxID=1084519 RepID=A0ABP8FB39_9BACT